MTLDDVGQLDWNKGDGLLPAVVQHARTGRVLMLGYMNETALRETLAGGRVVFYSRSRQSLWTKGETSGHFLDVVDVSTDCDADAILVLADPIGPTCHKGTESCFAEAVSVAAQRLAFLALLEQIIAQRIADQPEGSYTARLFRDGARRRDPRRRRTAQRVRRPPLPRAAAAQVPGPFPGARGGGTPGPARLERVSVQLSAGNPRFSPGRPGRRGTHCRSIPR